MGLMNDPIFVALVGFVMGVIGAIFTMLLVICMAWGDDEEETD